MKLMSDARDMKFVSRLNRSLGLSEGVIGHVRHVSRVTRGTKEKWSNGGLQIPTLHIMQIPFAFSA